MNHAEVQNQIVEYLQPELQKDNLFLVECIVSNGYAKVSVDSDTGITVEQCARINNILEKKLNEKFPFSEKYSLEVGSPGTNNPFKVIRQYNKYKGRQISILTTEGKRMIGLLCQVDEFGITLQINPRNKKENAEKCDIKFSEIKSATPIISFH